MKKHVLFLFCLIAGYALPLSAQQTVGLLSYNPSKAYDGYNLIYPHNQPNVYLLDNCGEIVHVWEDELSFRPGNTAYILPDGRLVKTKRPAAIAGDPIWAGGGGATVEIRDWDNNLEWSFTRNDENERLHHDIAITNTGNILMIVWEKITEEDAIQAGRKPGLITEGELWPDKIIEVNPTTNEIVWEWRAWDHLIQDFDDTKDNFGVVGDHPGRIDVNWDTSNGEADWMHSNALDFDPINDHVIISVPTFHEVWIIDHSTTTEQAAGSTGGNSGKGGELLYRWGNPATYRAGTEDDQKLFYQHDIHWIDDFVDLFDPFYRKLAVFNNRVGDDFSTVNIFSPAFDMYEGSFAFVDGKYTPTDFDITLRHPTPTELYSTGLSSVQYLPNGNFLICSGRFGYSFELTTDDEIVWEYKTPLIGGAPATQGDILSINNNLTFRIKRYPTDYSAFTGRDLSPQGWIELEPDEDFCDQIVPVAELTKNYKLHLTPNPAQDMVAVEWEGGIYVDIEVYDMMGRMKVGPMRLTGGRRYLDTSNWEAGMYVVRINQSEVTKLLITR
jgi:hypothetical protein